jgi:hypothetical protein
MGPLERRYLEVHPGASTGLRACRFLDERPGVWFTHAQLKAALGCSDRIIRDHLPQALNSGPNHLLEIDDARPIRYRARPRK